MGRRLISLAFARVRQAGKYIRARRGLGILAFGRLGQAIMQQKGG